MPVLRAGGGLCAEEYQLLLYAGQKGGQVLQKRPHEYSGAGVYHLHRLHAHCQRYGAADLSAAGLSGAYHHRQAALHGLYLRHAEHRRQFGRDADPLREPAESLPLHLLQHPHRGVHGDHGPAFCGVHHTADGVLPVRAAGAHGDRGRAHPAPHRPDRAVSGAVRAGHRHRVPGDPLLDRPCRDPGGAADR